MESLEKLLQEISAQEEWNELFKKVKKSYREWLKNTIQPKFEIGDCITLKLYDHRYVGILRKKNPTRVKMTVLFRIHKDETCISYSSRMSAPYSGISLTTKEEKVLCAIEKLR